MLGPLLLAFAGLLAAFLPVGLGLPDLPEAVPLLLLAAAGVWGAAAWRRRKSVGRLAAAAIPFLLLGAVATWMFLLSSYEAPGAAPDVGEPAPDVAATRVRDGARFELRAERGHDVLLVFFRGPW